MSRTSLQHRLEHIGLRAVVALVSRLPELLVWGLGWGLGHLAGSVFRIRRSVVDANLERAFPDASKGWRRKVARRTYVHFGREFLQMSRFMRASQRSLGDRIEVEGLELVRGPIAQGRGVIILTAHLGNWEMGAVGVTANGVALAAVAKRQANPLFDDYIHGLRAHLGITQVYQDVAPRQVLKWLRRPGAVALVADQNGGRAGIFVDFFGVPASTARGPAVFASRADCAVVLAAPHRLPGVRPAYVLRFTTVDPGRTGDPEADARALLQDYMRQLEAAIGESPEQYFWFHKRWKTRPSEEGAPEVRVDTTSEPRPAPPPMNSNHGTP